MDHPVDCCSVFTHLDSGTSQFCVRSLMGRSSSANRWSSSFMAPSSDGACDPDDDPAAAAACDDEIEAKRWDVEAPDDDDVDGPGPGGAPDGGGMSRPEVLRALITMAHELSVLLFMFLAQVGRDKTDIFSCTFLYCSFWRSAPLAM